MKTRLKLMISLALIVSMLQVPLFAQYSMMSNRQEAMMEKDIVEVAMGDEQFTTLVTALKAAGLVETLKGEGPFTVFAPTNNAFEKLPQGTVENLLKPENKEMLVDILTYHVAPGKLMAEDVLKLNGQEVKMANGKPAQIEIKGKDVYIDGAKVIMTDIVTKNGVIHVIDTVMLPPEK